MTGALEQGDALEWVWGPACESGQSGARVGYNGVTSIVVGCCAGPMGWYDVAVVSGNDGPDEFMPLHMAETFARAEAPEPTEADQGLVPIPDGYAEA